jgi:glycosyltransferase involved in cell wall biosynthesis
VDERFEITLFVSPRQLSGRFDIDRVAGRPGVRLVHFDHALTSATQFLRWPAALRRAQVDITLFPYHLGASLFGGGRRFAVIHDCILETDRRFAPDARTRALYIMLTRLVIRRTTIITPSQASASAILGFYGLTVPESHVLPWGVSASFDAASFDAASFDAAAVDAAAVGPASVSGVTDELSAIGGVRLPKNYYLHVGARRPHKNVQQLVRVLAGLRADDVLILVGSADQRWADPTMELARELGVASRILTFGKVSEPELAALYRRARAFLYPSLVEGFGLPLLEAMAAGAPVVASDIPVFREVAGDAAVFVPPADTSAWVGAIRGIDDAEHRATMIDAGQRRVAAATWEKSVDRLASILITR